MVFDVEDFMDKIYDKMANADTGINYEIGLINTEKDDGDVARYGSHVDLETLDLDNAITYFWPKKATNRNPYMIIYPKEHTTSEQDVEFVDIGIAILFNGKSDNLSDERRLLRYAKAAKRVLLKKRFSGYFSSSKVRTVGYEGIADERSAGKLFKYTAEVAISGELTNE